jgi:hypothetical protein
VDDHELAGGYMPVMQVFFALVLGLASLGSLAFAVISRRPEAGKSGVTLDGGK